MKCNKFALTYHLIIIYSLFGPTLNYYEIPLHIEHQGSSSTYYYTLTDETDTIKVKLSLNNTPNTVDAINQKSQQAWTLNYSSVQDLTTWQGWKRYILAIFIFTDIKYQHKIAIPKWKVEKNEQIMKIGPLQSSNALYQFLQNTLGFEPVVSIYNSFNQRNPKLHLGGYQEQFVEKSNDLFGPNIIWEHPLQHIGAIWALQAQSILLTSTRGENLNFQIVSHKQNVALSLESKWVILTPEAMKALILELNASGIVCRDASALTCLDNDTLQWMKYALRFKLSDKASINFTLSMLQSEYIQKTHEMQFYVKSGQLTQLSSIFFKKYYASIDLNRSMLRYSRLFNHGNENLAMFSINLCRFILCLTLFMIVAAMFACCYQYFANPFLRRRIEFVNGMPQIITYHKPDAFQY